MSRIVDEEYALVDLRQVVKDPLERTNVLKCSQVGLDDQRLRLAALNVHAIQQLGGHVISLLEHGPDTGELDRLVSNDMNKHRFAAPSGGRGSRPERSTLVGRFIQPDQRCPQCEKNQTLLIGG